MKELRFRTTFLLLLGGCAAAVCGCGADGASTPDTCVTRLTVRTAQPNPLVEPTLLDAAYVAIERDGLPLFDINLDLFGLEQGGTDVRVEDPGTGQPPTIPAGEDFSVRLLAYSSHESAPQSIRAVGTSPVFTCAGAENPSVPFYVGPAGGFAPTDTMPLADRVGATVTPLPGTLRAVIVGGGSQDSTVPSAEVYDHATGRYCDSDQGCATEPPPALSGHTATALRDGSVLIIGGLIPGSGSVSTKAFRFDPGTDAFEVVLDDPLLGRHRHTATLLDGINVPSVERGKVVVVGGCEGDCASGDVGGTAVLVDVQSKTVEALNLDVAPVPGYDATATLLTSGELLVAGGRDGAGNLIARIQLLGVATRSLRSADQSCPGTTGGGLCAGRAGHTATPLHDDNVLLWGGDVAANGSVEAPVAEVFVLDDDRSVPVEASAGYIQARIGHTATRLACNQSPCPVLIVGGSSADATQIPLRPSIFEVGAGAGVGAAEYSGTVQTAAASHPLAERAGHAAELLADGTLLLVGGTRPDNGAAAGAAVLGWCDAPSDFVCPGL